MPDNSANPIPSATVILADEARGGDDPFAVFLLRRNDSSSFMPGRYVFPGGRVEPADGSDPMAAATLARAALRELFEEAGVLLAHGRAPDPERLAEVRRALQRDLTTLDLAMDKLSMRPAPAALVPYARWITPQARKHRFDTTFFVAAMPTNQEARADERETTEGLWLSPAQALADNQAGKVVLAPPLVRILGGLAGFGGLGPLLEGGHDLAPVMPVLWAEGDMRVILFPDDDDYRLGMPGDPGHLGREVAAGRATRLVHRDGAWIPFARGG